MARMHLFELEDQDWFPALFRDAGTSYLSFLVQLMGGVGLLPHLRKAMAHSETGQIIDLCSGAGGPARVMADALAAEGHDVQVRCTDLYPNLPALQHAMDQADGRISLSDTPVDATHVPRELQGVRTMFNALHHFQPPMARRILADAVDARQPIAIFEVVGRDLPNLLGMLFVPFAVMALLPFLRPFRWEWIPFTYLLPIIPAFIQWDGVVSCLRVYTPDELRELVRGLDSYDWDIGHFPLPGTPGKGTYLVGTPRPA